MYPLLLVHVGPVLCQAKLRSCVVKRTVEVLNEKQFPASRRLLQTNLLPFGAHSFKITSMYVAYTFTKFRRLMCAT